MENQLNKNSSYHQDNRMASQEIILKGKVIIFYSMVTDKYVERRLTISTDNPNDLLKTITSDGLKYLKHFVTGFSISIIDIKAYEYISNFDTSKNEVDVMSKILPDITTNITYKNTKKEEKEATITKKEVFSAYIDHSIPSNNTLLEVI